MTLKISLTALAFVLGFANAVGAQEPRMYYAVGPMFSWQPAGTPFESPDMPKPGVGGDAFGIIGAVGVMLSPRISIAGEISVPARLVATQELHYSFSAQYENRYRDLIVSALLRGHATTLTTPRVHPEAVVGLSYVHESNVERVAYQVGPAFPLTGIYEPFGPERTTTRDTFAFTVGADVGIAVANHLAVVPQARLHVISRNDFTQSDMTHATLFLSKPALRIGVLLRATF